MHLDYYLAGSIMFPFNCPYLKGIFYNRKNMFCRSVEHFFFTDETYVLGAQKNHLGEMVLLSTHNLCFG